MYVSIVLVKNQNPQDMVDFKVELDEEFEYLGNQLSNFWVEGRCVVCLEI
jgi:hypothetical protein